MVEYKYVLHGVLKIEDSKDLLILDGTDRDVSKVFESQTIILNGVKQKHNRLDFSIESKFKSKGYKTLYFCDNDVAVYTKNPHIIKNGVDVTVTVVEVKIDIEPVVDVIAKEIKKKAKTSFGNNLFEKKNKNENKRKDCGSNREF